MVTAAPEKTRPAVTGTTRYDADVVKRAAAGRGAEILAACCGLPSEFLNGQHGPCPKCGGTDRFRYDQSGEFCLCGQCFHEKNGDIFAAIMWLRCVTFPDAVRIVAEHLGVTPASRPLHQHQPPKPKKTFAHHRTALMALDRTLGPHSATWEYHDAAGETVGVIARWDTPNGKTIRPISRHGTDWIHAGMPEPRPLYGLPSLTSASTVWVCEGEKAVEAARSIGLTATTSPHGALSPSKADWSPLAGRDVNILPDADASGWKYATAVASILQSQSPPATVRIVTLPNLPAGGDICEWIDAHGDTAEPEALRSELAQLADATPAWLPPKEQAAPNTTTTAMVEPGTLVKAKDRDNFGTVVTDLGDRCLVHFVSPEGQAADVELSKSQLVTQDGKPLSASDETQPPVEYPLMTCAELMVADVTQNYLVDGVIPEAQPVIVAGPKKCLKTSLLLCLAMALATAVRFLGWFTVKQAVKVCIMTGESGLATIKETIIRQAAAMGIDPAQIDNLFITESLPAFGSPAHIEGIRLMVTKHNLKALIIDPTYMCMDGTDAGNLFTQGVQLRAVSEACRQGGCSLILAHHTRKNIAQPFGIPELEDIAWAGFQEFARAWMLVNRRERYLPGTGSHRLWLSCGGSAGHGSLHGLNVEEGKPPHRIWDALLIPFDELKQATSDARERSREESSQQQLDADRRKVVQAIAKYPAGETKNVVRDGAGLSGTRFSRALASLVNDKTIVSTTIQKGGRTAPREAYKLQETSA